MMAVTISKVGLVYLFNSSNIPIPISNTPTASIEKGGRLGIKLQVGRNSKNLSIPKTIQNIPNAILRILTKDGFIILF